MKRLFIVFFSVIFLLNLCGCNQKSGDPVNNKVFTDEFFQDVVQIRVGFIDDPITDEQLAAVARYLKSLRLTHSEEDLPEQNNLKYGGWTIISMCFIKADGTTLKIRVSQWAMSDLPDGSYYITDYREAIERGDKSILSSLWEACGRDPEAYPFFC